MQWFRKLHMLQAKFRKLEINIEINPKILLIGQKVINNQKVYHNCNQDYRNLNKNYLIFIKSNQVTHNQNQI